MIDRNFNMVEITNNTQTHTYTIQRGERDYLRLNNVNRAWYGLTLCQKYHHLWHVISHSKLTYPHHAYCDSDDQFLHIEHHRRLYIFKIRAIRGKLIKEELTLSRNWLLSRSHVFSMMPVTRLIWDLLLSESVTNNDCKNNFLIPLPDWTLNLNLTQTTGLWFQIVTDHFQKL